uniref:Uncharacterized protein n=1 Tax=Solanum lycopersicum TaxID=4081 RepID=A0A3Q7IAP0_SOLLC
MLSKESPAQQPAETLYISKVGFSKQNSSFHSVFLLLFSLRVLTYWSNQLHFLLFWVINIHLRGSSSLQSTYRLCSLVDKDYLLFW